MNNQNQQTQYETVGGVTVHVCQERVVAADSLDQLLDDLNERRGLLLSSGYEVPGRYRRYDIGFVDPPLVITTRARNFDVLALSERGRPLLQAFHHALRSCSLVQTLTCEDSQLRGQVPAGNKEFPEEERTRQPSVLSVLRCIVQAMTPRVMQPGPLGLYGAFGYDLVFQFEDLVQRLPRKAEQRELVLYVPDQMIVRDELHDTAHRYSYDFSFEGQSTRGVPRTGTREAYRPSTSGHTGPTTVQSDHAPGQFEAQVMRAKQAFSKGELFEVTPGQTFSLPCRRSPADLFRQLAVENPAPFAFLANLGEQEYLVGASPEMYVRVQGRQVETCPIAGTIARGSDALQDATAVEELLGCTKSAAELTMCTDVDRNDKARVCEAGSVKIVGRRQLEFYSRLIHTVDHVKGRLRSPFDALDALVTHCWAVTVTGAPKQAAMQFLEDNEASSRRFYGGAVGVVGFDGSLNTGLTLRTIHIEGKRATVRAGATLLHASEPQAEAQECALKASALLAVLQSIGPKVTRRHALSREKKPEHTKPQVLLIDHRDSFVHTLADYFRQAGANVSTHRHGVTRELYNSLQPQLVVLSPGPGRPSDFDTQQTLELALLRKIPVFGVCLGLQAIVEYFGGELSTLPTPQHGRASPVRYQPVPLFAGLPQPLQAGRYHSLYAGRHQIPPPLRIVATSSDDDCVMAVQHRSLPVTAVQFHPESLLSAQSNAGLRLISNLLSSLPSI